MLTKFDLNSLLLQYNSSRYYVMALFDVKEEKRKTASALQKQLKTMHPSGIRPSNPSLIGVISQSQYHGKIDWDVAKRFLEVVYGYGPIKRTNLAMKAGINYTTCTRYILWMTEVGWIDIDDNLVKLTEHGIQVCLRLFLATDCSIH